MGKQVLMKPLSACYKCWEEMLNIPCSPGKAKSLLNVELRMSRLAGEQDDA